MDEVKTYSVLVVDDNDDVRRLVKKVLESRGHRIMEAADGAGALDTAQAEPPDLILMDIRLPGEMNGLQATEKILEDPQLTRVPVVALTASVTEKDQQLATDAGCTGFITKPIDIRLLPDLVVGFIESGGGANDA